MKPQVEVSITRKFFDNLLLAVLFALIAGGAAFGWYFRDLIVWSAQEAIAAYQQTDGNPVAILEPTPTATITPTPTPVDPYNMHEYIEWMGTSPPTRSVCRESAVGQPHESLIIGYFIIICNFMRPSCCLKHAHIFSRRHYKSTIKFIIYFHY